MSWMPKSDKLYYTVTALTGNDVITLDPATLREETILQSIPEQSFRWSPNEDFLIYYPREEGVKEDGPLRRIVSPAAVSYTHLDVYKRQVWTRLPYLCAARRRRPRTDRGADRGDVYKRQSLRRSPKPGAFTAQIFS